SNTARQCGLAFGQATVGVSGKTADRFSDADDTNWRDSVLIRMAILTQRLEAFRWVFPRVKPILIVRMMHMESCGRVPAFYARPIVPLHDLKSHPLPTRVFQFF